MKLKVCGMKSNTTEVAALQPDYLGFIFWDSSSRYFEDEIPKLPDGIEKIGVFVDAAVEEILEKCEKYDLHGVQLHGDESPAFCETLRAKLEQATQINAMKIAPDTKSDIALTNQTKIIKVFSVKNSFNFSSLQPFESLCDYYLFDTKGELPGGNGYAFDWNVLKNYPSTKPYFLSGGIGMEQMESIEAFMKMSESIYCHAIDVNSRFEIQPGLKDQKKLMRFKAALIRLGNEYDR